MEVFPQHAAYLNSAYKGVIATCEENTVDSYTYIGE
jgi:hypothetical protein